MLDIQEIINKNRKSKEEWVKNHKEAYAKKFEQYCDYDNEKLDKFMSSMEYIVSTSEDSILLPEVYGFNTRTYHPQYPQILNEDGSINIEKFNQFLDNIEQTLYWSNMRVGHNIEAVAGKRDSFDSDAKNICIEHYRKAFPEGQKGQKGVEFFLQHFFKNEECKGLVELITPDINERYQNNPEAGKNFLERVKAYRKNSIIQSREASSPSNNLDKLFAGSSSSLGKGLDGKSKS